MLLRTPYLDDRRFEDIVDELKSRISLYCPEWTDHNVSDPGVTMIELFAYMAEQLIFRMNQVPDLHYMRFVQFLGIPIPTPQPAHVGVTIWLTKPLPAAHDDAGQSAALAKGTRVATTQTETVPPLFFTIEEDARIRTPYIVEVVKDSRDSGLQSPLLEPLFSNTGAGIDLFSTQPHTDDAFIFYFGNDLSQHVLQLRLELVDKRGTNISTEQPPVVWEVFSENNEWERIEGEDCIDETKGLNASGPVRLFLPRLGRLSDSPAQGVRYGLRVRVEKEEYRQTPHLLRIREIAALGITLDAAYQQEAADEFLGVSDGSPGQRYRLEHSPIILPLKPEETVEINGESWLYVENFAWPETGSSAQSSTLKCFTVDVLTNEICLPPAIRRPNGEITLYGAVPPRNAQITIRRYRYGADALMIPHGEVHVAEDAIPVRLLPTQPAEVARGEVNVLTTSIPYINRVENRYPATGGQQLLPSLDALRIETQRYLRTGNRNRFLRAVTTEEYENLVLERFPDEVGKVECCLEQLEGAGSAQPPVKHLTVYVTAKIPVRSVLAGAQFPEVRPSVIAQIDQLLHQHRLLTNRVRASNPQFVWLDVVISLLGARDAAFEAHVQQVIAAFLNPIYGGDNGSGWRLNQKCTPAQLLQRLKLVLPPAAAVSFRAATLEEQDPRWLFDVDLAACAACGEALNNGAVSERLLTAFAVHGHDLTNQAQARVRSSSAVWSIEDNDKKYCVRQEAGKLRVYDDHDDPPTARLYILRNCGLVYE